MNNKILLVEDEKILREMLEESLLGKGYAVQAALDVESALNYLNSNNYDVIVTDIKLPKTTGLEFLNKLQEVSPETPVIIMTGYPSMGIAMEALKDGASDFLPKPFKIEVLDSSIKKALKVSKVQKDNVIDAEVKSISTSSFGTHKRLENKIKELSLIGTVNDALNSIRNKDTLFDTLMELSFVITDFDNAFIMVVDRSENRLIVRNDTFEKPLTGTEFSLGVEPFLSVLKDKQFFYEDVTSGPLTALTGSENPTEGVPVFMAPISLGENALIILGVSGATSGQVIEEEELSAMRNLAMKASLKLENLSLVESTFSNILSTIETLVETIGLRDNYTRDHSHRVTEYALKIGAAYGATQNILHSISFAGPLHDIGMIGLKDDILLKEGKYSKDEWEFMQAHVVHGEEILRPLNLHEDEKAIILHHHEWWDGSGYPNCLKGEGIPLVARIFSIADAYDAMTTERPYKDALTHEEAIKEIENFSGSQFDPEVVKTLAKAELKVIRKDLDSKNPVS